MSLASAGGFGFAGRIGDSERLETASDAAPAADFEIGPADWPTLRANNVRTAMSPAGVPDKVQFYCFEAASGRRLWRFRAAPAERVIPVNGSLRSTWPVASGVLVEDGTAYAAAGIANYDGTHVFALDAETGRLRWRNHTSGSLDPQTQSGVSVNGHLLLHGSPPLDSVLAISRSLPLLISIRVMAESPATTIRSPDGDQARA